MLPPKGLQAQQQHHLLFPRPGVVLTDLEHRSQQTIKGPFNRFLTDQVIFISGSDSVIGAKSSSFMQFLGFLFLRTEMIPANFRLKSAHQLNPLKLSPLQILCFPTFTIKLETVERRGQAEVFGPPRYHPTSPI